MKHLGTKQDLKIEAGQVLSLPCQPEEGAQLAEDSSAFTGRACAVGSFYHPYPRAALVRKDVLKAVPLSPAHQVSVLRGRVMGERVARNTGD